MNLDRFYLIIDHPDWLRRLLPLGVKMVQLRCKELPTETVRGYIRQSLSLCRMHGSILVVNDFWELALEEGCDWVHLGQEDLETADVNAIIGAGVRLGISTHDHAELQLALSLKPHYVALGPIYPTILKQMKWAPQGLKRISEWKKRIGEIPLVAIGGLTTERATGVIAAGADILSVVTDVTRNKDPEKRTREWLELTR